MIVDWHAVLLFSPTNPKIKILNEILEKHTAVQMLGEDANKNFFHEDITITLNSRILPTIQDRFITSQCRLFKYYYWQNYSLACFYFTISILYAPRTL